MNIQTRYHGEILIEEKEIWQFEKGVPGFEAEKQFVILSLPDNDVFQILQSITTAELAFVITNPFDFMTSYDFTLDETDVHQLGIENEKEILVSTILTVRDPFTETTANLQAPIIFNTKNHQAKQVILTDTNYQTRHKLFEQEGQ